MADQTVWLAGEAGSFTYNDADQYSADPTMDLEGFRTTGQAIIEETPTEDHHVARLEDLTTVVGRLPIIAVADIDNPAAELLVLSATLIGTHLFAYQTTGTGFEYTVYEWDSDSPVVNSPYVVQGNGGRWRAGYGKYSDQAQNFSSTLAVVSNATIGGTLGVTGASTLAGAVSCSTTLGVTGASTLTGAVTCGATLGVTGLLTASAAITVGTTLTVTGEGAFSAGCTVADVPSANTDVVRKLELDALDTARMDTLLVANIDDPSTELNAIAGVSPGDTKIVYQVVTPATAPDWYTIYAWDSAGGTESVPEIVDGSSGVWVAIAGQHSQNADIAGTLKVDNISDHDDGTISLIGLGITEGVVVNPDREDINFIVNGDTTLSILYADAGTEVVTILDLAITNDAVFNTEVHGSLHNYTFSSGKQAAVGDTIDFLYGAADVNGSNLGVQLSRAGSVVAGSVNFTVAAFASGATVTANILINDSVIATVTSAGLTGNGQEQLTIINARDTAGDTFSAGDILRVTMTKLADDRFEIEDVVFDVVVYYDTAYDA